MPEASKPENTFTDILPPAHGYALGEVRLEWPDAATVIFRARLHGPAGWPVWVRAWLSTESGTLAESASPPMCAGDEVALEVKLRGAVKPQSAYMRIESAPLQTEHVVGVKLA